MRVVTTTPDWLHDVVGYHVSRLIYVCTTGSSSGLRGSLLSCCDFVRNARDSP